MAKYNVPEWFAKDNFFTAPEDSGADIYTDEIRRLYNKKKIHVGMLFNNVFASNSHYSFSVDGDEIRFSEEDQNTQTFKAVKSELKVEDPATGELISLANMSDADMTQALFNLLGNAIDTQENSAVEYTMTKTDMTMVDSIAVTTPGSETPSHPALLQAHMLGFSFKGLWSGIKNAVAKVGNKIKEVFTGKPKIIMSQLFDMIPKPAADSKWATMWNIANNAINSDAVVNLIDEVQASFDKGEISMDVLKERKDALLARLQAFKGPAEASKKETNPSPLMVVDTRKSSGEEGSTVVMDLKEGELNGKYHISKVRKLHRLGRPIPSHIVGVWGTPTDNDNDGIDMCEAFAELYGENIEYDAIPGSGDSGGDLEGTREIAVAQPPVLTPEKAEVVIQGEFVNEELKAEYKSAEGDIAVSCTIEVKDGKTVITAAVPEGEEIKMINEDAALVITDSATGNELITINKEHEHDEKVVSGDEIGAFTDLESVQLGDEIVVGDKKTFDRADIGDDLTVTDQNDPNFKAVIDITGVDPDTNQYKGVVTSVDRVENLSSDWETLHLPGNMVTPAGWITEMESPTGFNVKRNKKLGLLVFEFSGTLAAGCSATDVWQTQTAFTYADFQGYLPENCVTEDGKCTAYNMMLSIPVQFFSLASPGVSPTTVSSAVITFCGVHNTTPNLAIRFPGMTFSTGVTSCGFTGSLMMYLAQDGNINEFAFTKLPLQGTGSDKRPIAFAPYSGAGIVYRPRYRAVKMADHVGLYTKEPVMGDAYTEATALYVKSYDGLPQEAQRLHEDLNQFVRKSLKGWYVKGSIVGEGIAADAFTIQRYDGGTTAYEYGKARDIAMFAAEKAVKKSKKRNNG